VRSIDGTMPPAPQAVLQTLTKAAIFLVATINSGSASCAAIRTFCGDLPGLLRAVGFRAIEGDLSCVLGIGSDAWDRLFGQPRPAELHPFREIKAGARRAIATTGDLLFHIRAKRHDLCFELAKQIMARLGDSVSVVDEVHGFRYFDDRDLIGFVDGTENPTASWAAGTKMAGAKARHWKMCKQSFSAVRADAAILLRPVPLGGDKYSITSP
jgi:porphyrinogen peroxidase